MEIRLRLSDVSAGQGWQRKTAAFVIHGGGIMAILGEFARPKRDFYDYHIGNGAIAEYAYQNNI